MWADVLLRHSLRVCVPSLHYTTMLLAMLLLAQCVFVSVCCPKTKMRMWSSCTIRKWTQRRSWAGVPLWDPVCPPQGCHSFSFPPLHLQRDCTNCYMSDSTGSPPPTHTHHTCHAPLLLHSHKHKHSISELIYLFWLIEESTSPPVYGKQSWFTSNIYQPFTCT